MRLVLDTNVWLDWLVFDDPGIASLKTAVEERRAEVCIDAECYAELEHVLARDRGRIAMDAEARGRLLARVRELARLVQRDDAPGDSGLPRCRDRDDQKFLRLAGACGADALLTKDRALLVLTRRRARPVPFAIVPPDGYRF